MIAVGVASPSAHGQAMTSTATAGVRAATRLACRAKYQTRNVSRATPSTAGTKKAEIVSASFCTGALLPWASSTSRTIDASIVWSPLAVTRYKSVPLPLSVPPITPSPFAFSTGRLSPVSRASSTAEAPSVTTPSAATFSPGRTRSRSPGFRLSRGTSTSPPFSVTSLAVLGDRAIKDWMVSDARRFARASSQRPSRISVTIVAAVSK